MGGSEPACTNGLACVAEEGGGVLDVLSTASSVRGVLDSPAVGRKKQLWFEALLEAGMSDDDDNDERRSSSQGCDGVTGGNGVRRAVAETSNADSDDQSYDTADSDPEEQEEEAKRQQQQQVDASPDAAAVARRPRQSVDHLSFRSALKTRAKELGSLVDESER